MSTSRVMAVIPHRRPALLVDRVVEVEPRRRLVAHKAVTVAEPGYGALSRNPTDEDCAYPLGLLLESWAQCAVALACWEEPNPDVRLGKVALLTQVRDARTLAPVHPGSVLAHEVTVVRDLGDTYLVTGRSTVDGTPVMEIGQVTLALRDMEVLTGAVAESPVPETTTHERA
ncbi:3-hydroxyacyl-ACP dehydratase FabZ family protein [Streptomyces sp. TRM64462]|uniref:3-hydroxyacyl-ACP dehydratase FabZ family protein n=1 Tax=Streptomyces sp. TRM64462 TaxID=2741726 RepID=UPI001586D6A5|nr:3-hydroxyacyl-ACP dehydratase [Streptomyces sp. TRM64462]